LGGAPITNNYGVGGFGDALAGGKMKTTGTTLWTSPNIGATNESGFASLPGGYRVKDGRFTNVGANGYWWTELPDGPFYSIIRYLKFDDTRLVLLPYEPKGGFSVRCIKN
jgi:uncharacterized protein (TIGR02145 family)